MKLLMKYEEAEKLIPTEVKRLCGVYPETFELMVEIVKVAQKQKKVLGRPSKLSTEDKVLMTLEYLREYRTYFHIAKDWGVYESTAFRIIRKVEDVLIKSSSFKLPGKKKLWESEAEPKVIVIDVTESKIERPKKTEAMLFRKKKESYIEVSSGRQSGNRRNHLYFFWARRKP